MKRTTRLLSLSVQTLMVALLVGCIADEVGGIFMLTHEVDDFLSVGEHGTEVQFQAGDNWRAWTTDEWLGVSPESGKGGKNSIIVWTIKPNHTRQRRSAQVIIESGGKQERLTIWQRNEFALFDEHEYVVGCEGGLVDMPFSSNISRDSLLISYFPAPWVGWLKDSVPASTRSVVWNGKLKTLKVEPNNTPEERSSVFILVIPAGERIYHPLDTAWIRQEGNPDAIIEVPSDSTSSD